MDMPKNPPSFFLKDHQVTGQIIFYKEATFLWLYKYALEVY